MANESVYSKRLSVFSQLGLKVQEASSIDDIYTYIGEGLKESGFACVIWHLDEEQKNLTLEYSSIDPLLVKKVEKLLNLKAIGHKVSVEDVASFVTAIRERRAVFSARPTEALKETLPPSLAPLAGQIVRILGVGKGIAAPLIARGKILGILDVMSRDISERDIPIVVAFANHTAIAIDNTQLRSGLEARAKELEESEHKYRLLLENINDGYIVYQGTEIVLANQRFAEIFGYTVDQVLGQSYTRFVAPDELKEAMELYEKVIGGNEEIKQYEVKGLKADKTKIMVDLSIKEMEYDGKPAFSVIFRDITERKQIEQALLESEQHHRVLMEMASNLGEAIIIVGDNKDEPVTISFINDAAINILGYSREELLQLHLRDLVMPSVIDEVEGRYQSLRAGDRSAEHYKTIALTKNGTELLIDVMAGSTIYKGKPAIIAFFREIT